MKNYLNDENFFGFLIIKLVTFLFLLFLLLSIFGVTYFLAYKFVGMTILFRGRELSPYIF